MTNQNKYTRTLYFRPKDFDILEWISETAETEDRPMNRVIMKLLRDQYEQLTQRSDTTSSGV